MWHREKSFRLQPVRSEALAMGRFYRHVLIEKNYPHHGAVAFGHYGKALFEVFKYIGVPMEDINYNQPASLPYPTENPFA